MKNYKLFLTFLIIFFLILAIFIFFNLSNQNTSISQSKKCKNLNYEQIINLHPEKFSPINMEIKFLNEKDWRKILFQSEISAKKNKDDYGSKFYNRSKRTEAILNIKISENLSCLILANIRPHGLLDDHRDGGQILPSLNIELKDGNIFGITKFILFRPSTRGWDNEIIITNILKELGFLSPRTTKAVLKYNDQIMNFLFQESISKEFLEINNLKEAPFYDGDNKFFIYLDIFKESQLQNLTYILTKHRVINNQWSFKNSNAMKISKEGLSILNMFIENYISNLKIERELIIADYNSIEKKLNNSSYFKNFEVYDAINFALRAEHGLSIDDRIYYYDALNEIFLPIYWDGMANLVNRFNDVIKEEKSNLIFTPSIKSGASQALEIFNDLKKDEVFNEIKKHNVNFSEKNFNEIIEIVKANLIKFEDMPEKNIFLPKIVTVENFPNELTSVNNAIFNNYRFIFEKENLSEYLNCNVSSEDCLDYDVTEKDILKLIKSDLKKKNKYYIYTGKVKNPKYSKNFWFYNSIKQLEKQSKTIKEKNFNFIINGNIDYKIDYKNRIISFLKKSSYGNVVFNKLSLDNWKIIFDNENSKIFPGIDLFNLTGCLNFYDTLLDSISIKITNSNCEDAVNFVRSKGKLDNLFIENSAFDSIDADFSDLIFNNIEVLKSKNDCVDFSYGKYKINSAKIFDCGDKGISVGELSSIKGHNINIDKANIGIASKDFADVEIFESKIEQVNYCAQAYNKKQEFYGGSIIFKNFDCKNFQNQFKIDKMSQILIQ